LSSLNYHVYDEDNENLFVHHDHLLPAFPLCVEWLDFPSGGPSRSDGKTHGNYIAVGTMDPSIEIFDMDVLEGVYPEAILGPAAGADLVPKAKGTGKKKKRVLQTSPDHHVASVTSLSWTPFHRNLLLSSSADMTVKLWDLAQDGQQKAIRSWDNIHPNEKVLAVEWNKFGNGEHSKVVLSAGERTVKVWDTRAAQDGLSTGGLGSDVEAICWDPWAAMDFYVSDLVFRRMQETDFLPIRSRLRMVWCCVTTPECSAKILLDQNTQYPPMTGRYRHYMSTRTCAAVLPREEWTRR
jgi:periodic tryptophan protein 1